MITKDKWHHIFHVEEFELPVPSQGGEMRENVFFCIHDKILNLVD